MPLREAREAFERDYLAAQLSRFGGNISTTANFVGMERSALHRKIKLLGVGASAGPRTVEHVIPQDATDGRPAAIDTGRQKSEM